MENMPKRGKRNKEREREKTSERGIEARNNAKCCAAGGQQRLNIWKEEQKREEE